jgi:hypothetical protein
MGALCGEDPGGSKGVGVDRGVPSLTRSGKNLASSDAG